MNYPYTEEKRTSVRFPYSSTISYMTMGGIVNPPDEKAVTGEIVDLSNSGMRIRIVGRSLEIGTVLRVRIPISNTQATLPVLTQVKWIREIAPGDYQAGLRFIA